MLSATYTGAPISCPGFSPASMTMSKPDRLTHTVEVYLGDYIDRGASSREVIELLIARQKVHDTIFLQGNHEDYVLKFLSDPTALSKWKKIGGLDTILSYGVNPARRDDPQSQHQVAIALSQAMPDSHHRFLRGLALSFTCGDFFFAHAGVRPESRCNCDPGVTFSGFGKTFFCMKRILAR